MVPSVEAMANVRRRGGEGRIFRYGSFCRSHGECEETSKD